MYNQADIAAYGPEGQLRLVVETKRVFDVKPEWAAEYRRNLLFHGTIPNAPFFLLATADHFFLWKDRETSSTQIPPDYIVETPPMIGSRIERLGIPLQQLSGSGFEMLIISWIHDVIDMPESKIRSDVSHQWLIDSGLYAAVRQAVVAVEAFA